MKARRALLVRAAGATMAFALPLAGLWVLALYVYADDPRALRWAGVAIYGAAMVAAVFVGRRLQR